MEIDGVFKEIQISAQLIKGLTLFNQAPRRQNIFLDKSFIKGLLIGICTLDGIRNATVINKDILSFIRELFLIRIGGNDKDGSRYLSFNDLVRVSCMEIRANNFG